MKQFTGTIEGQDFEWSTEARTWPSSAPRRDVQRDGRRILRDNISTSSVKSARRALEIFEFFHDFKRPATVVEISDALGFPQSSTSALLKSLVNLGYIAHDPLNRTYISSARVALLGSWINSSFTSQGAVLRLMEAVGEATGEASVLMGRLGVYVQHLHVVPPKDLLAPQVAVGYLRPLTSAAAGYVMLNEMRRDEVVLITRRLNAELPPGGRRVEMADLQVRIDDVRRRGYGLYCEPHEPIASVQVALPRRLSQDLVTVGITSTPERMARHADRYAQILFDAIANA